MRSSLLPGIPRWVGARVARCGWVPKQDGVLVQECGASLVRVKRDGGTLAFAAPPLTRCGPVAEAEMGRIAARLWLPCQALLDASWLVNGPEWIGVLLE